jgi:hypothetical protein
MRKIVVSISAAALALSMLAQAMPAAAVTGYDSAYAGESAFVNLSPGQSNEFQVFFANTGTTAWAVGTATQVDLAACLADKVTCNAQDSTEATWNSGWLSATRYATTTQTLVAPGSIATFKYTVMAPSGAAAGTYRFNGDLVLSSTGERIHPEGYYQDATVGAGSGAPTITSLTPNNGPAGTDVVIAGSGFVCTPAFPTASFGGTNGTTLSCGASSITVDAPAHALGAVTLTVTNQGSAASNGLTYTYTDVTGPTYTSLSVSGDAVYVTFDEPVCGTYVATDWEVQNVSSPATDYLTGSTSNLPTDCDDAVSTFAIFLNQPLPNGSFVETTIQSGTNTTDASANAAKAPQAHQATAVAPETTKPTISSASGAVGSTTINVNFSEPVYCDVGQPLPGDWSVDAASGTDPTVTAVTGCPTTRSTADTQLQLTIASGLAASTSYTVTLGAAGAGDIQDAVGNALTTPASAIFTSGAGDFTPPTITDARMVNNVLTTDFTEAGDSFSLTFSEEMTGVDETGTIALQDQDGTTLNLDCAAATVSCEWDDAATTVTVTITTTLADNGDGTTPGMQIPFNVTTLNGFADLQGNVPNVLGSPDRLVDYE